MTHFCAFVFTTDRPDQDGLDQLLWPWSLYNLESHNRRWFDYCEIGGRFESQLDPPGCATDPSLVRGQRQKRTIQVDALRERAVLAAAADYDETQRILAGRPLPDIADLTRVHGENGWSDVFHADPAVKAVQKILPFRDPWELAALAAPRDVVLARAAERALLPYAFVDGGVWHTYGGFCLDEDQATADAWSDLFRDAFDAMAPHAWLTIVDCHC